MILRANIEASICVLATAETGGLRPVSVTAALVTSLVQPGGDGLGPTASHPAGAYRTRVLSGACCVGASSQDSRVPAAAPLARESRSTDAPEHAGGFGMLPAGVSCPRRT